MSWQDLDKIISNIQKKQVFKKKFQNSALEDFLKKRYNIDNFFWHAEKIEIKAESTILAQELFLKKEEIKKEINNFFKKNNSNFEIKEIIIRTGK